jgi:RNA polymerase sigma-70 factor, ECF subfamily
MADGVEVTWEDAWQAARAAWPGVEIDRDEFVEHVRACAGHAAASSAVAASMQLTDLYLACACGLSVPAALSTFDRVLLVQVPRLVSRVTTSASVVADVQQNLREKLFLGAGGRRPGITSYHGRGSLIAWLRVVAVRAAVDVLRSDARDDVAIGDDLADELSDDVELSAAKAQHREEFQAAVIEALRALTARERNLLRLHLTAGVSTHKLAAMFRVDQSTVVRWISAARDRIRAAIQARLCERLGLRPTELDSLAGLLLSRLDVSLAGCLRSQDG